MTGIKSSLDKNSNKIKLLLFVYQIKQSKNCIYKLIMIGKLATQLNSILQDLANQNKQINSTIKSLKKVKSEEKIRPKTIISVIEFPNIQKIIKGKKPQEIIVKKSKAFSRCSSCKLIGSNQNKQNCSKINQRGKVINKKNKTLSLLEVQRQSFIQKAKSPLRKSYITNKYMAILNVKKTKKL